ncbi:MAG: hypothetical protein M3R27_13160 [Bacteroidota bacterium]|nr:hypothetical protein [Bacteroidota bacterium]
MLVKKILFAFTILFIALPVFSQVEVSENLFRFFSFNSVAQLKTFDEVKSFLSADEKRFHLINEQKDNSVLQFSQTTGPYAHKLQPDSLMHFYSKHSGLDSNHFFSGTQSYYYRNLTAAKTDLETIIRVLGLPSVKQFQKELNAIPGIKKKDKKKLSEGYIYQREIFVLADPENSENLYRKYEVKVSMDEYVNPKKVKGNFTSVIHIEFR